MIITSSVVHCIRWFICKRRTLNSRCSYRHSEREIFMTSSTTLKWVSDCSVFPRSLFWYKLQFLCGKIYAPSISWECWTISVQNFCNRNYNRRNFVNVLSRRYLQECKKQTKHKHHRLVSERLSAYDKNFTCHDGGCIFASLAYYVLIDLRSGRLE